MKQSELNEFCRLYFNQYKTKYHNAIKHDPGTSKEHRKLVAEICEWAIQNKYDFYTRVFLKEGKIVDIIIPALLKPFIEIRSSEEKKDKKYLAKYKDMITFVDCSDPFKLI